MAEPWKPITGLDELASPSASVLPQPKSGKGAKSATAAQPATVEEARATSTPRCTLCGNVLTTEFYFINALLACPNCAALARAGKPIHSPTVFKQGLTLGIGAAVVGIIFYAGFTIFTHIYLGYLALAVGWLVGKGMMRGSNGLGGQRYQITAVLLTYAAISLADVLIRIAALAPAQDMDWAGQFVTIVVLGLFAPLLDPLRGLSGVIGLVMLLVGMRMAWKATAARPLEVDGPHDILG